MKPSEQRGGTTPDEAETREKGEWAEVTATLTVPQRPQRTRTFFVICTRCIASAKTLPHCTQT